VSPTISELELILLEWRWLSLGLCLLKSFSQRKWKEKLPPDEVFVAWLLSLSFL
jgi:hypothetical protein